MSDQNLVERYRALSSDLDRLEQEIVNAKHERAQVCGQLLAKDGKGVSYDLGDGIPMVITSTKVGTYYMVAKNKWQKVPKQAKTPKVVKPVKPLTVKKIIGGKIVEIPVERKPKLGDSDGGTAEGPNVEKPRGLSEPAVQALTEIKLRLDKPQKASVAEAVVSGGANSAVSEGLSVGDGATTQKQPELVATVSIPAAPAKPLDPLEAALAELDALDLE